MCDDNELYPYDVPDHVIDGLLENTRRPTSYSEEPIADRRPAAYDNDIYYDRMNDTEYHDE